MTEEEQVRWIAMGNMKRPPMTTPTDKSEVSSLAYDLLHMTAERDTLQSQLTDLRAQMDTTRAECAHMVNAMQAQVETKVEEAENLVDEQWLEAIAKYWVKLTGNLWETRDGETSEEGRHSNVTAIFQHIEYLHEQLDKSNADGAVMRGALKDILPFLHRCNDEDCPERKVKIQGERALSTDAGRDLLARYREAVDLVWLVREEQPQVGDQMSPDWATRADTLLATVKGDL